MHWWPFLVIIFIFILLLIIVVSLLPQQGQKNRGWLQEWFPPTAVKEPSRKHMIPIIIICFNNYKYVEHMVHQLLKKEPNWKSRLLILDNASNDPKTKHFLKTSGLNVIYNRNNEGPWITPTHNSTLYEKLPKTFIMTDPDVEFHPYLPLDFIERLEELSEKYKTWKIGFALDISDAHKMFDENYYHEGKSIFDWELQFWQKKIPNFEYELYEAEIDTTFCLVNKNYIHTNKHIRIAGVFTAKHLPWYKNNKLFNIYETLSFYEKTTSISSISSLVKKYIQTHFLKIYKSDQFFLIEKDPSDNHLGFWEHIYPQWRTKTFEVLDIHLDNEKIFLEIGGWIGPVTLYASRKSQHVYVVEEDPLVSKYLLKNCSYNSSNVTLVPTLTWPRPRTKQGTQDQQAPFFHHPVLKNIQTNQISLIKIDITRKEDMACLEDFVWVHTTFHTPLLISFPAGKFPRNGLDPFSFLTKCPKKQVLHDHPCISVFLG